ncbi:adenosylcobinamide-phosphate guanylyltransferase [Halovenus aranensis]|jgi:adenosylcobinamide-phosphate guanylyltransferase|uniref:Adenosylcobinamide-phosphate guanylyltransferase n=1 Tax=Halovenus aranensis TaxID=890420 RepID=A0A1G8UA45_9EURY|nr:NTP transferase domain-containing protein [Halovenus aranensis]SDJ50666.1 adenosylcobinamide-phosphate guanylyltransferase [Halovenus aranensis]
MCGGEGTRLDTPVEKPLYEIGGDPMVCRVLNALEASAVEHIHAAVSPATPETRERLAAEHVAIIDTPGTGYVEDLQHVLDGRELPVLTVAADLPLLDGKAVDYVLEIHEGGSLSVYTPSEVKTALGLGYDITVEAGERTLVPSGINVVGDREDSRHVTEDFRFAVNVNRRRDGQIAEALL